MAEINPSAYFAALQNDRRLEAWHIAIVAALLHIATGQGGRYRLTASRREVMALSHIRSLPTYHKYLRGLQELGYIVYSPSFHPRGRSQIELVPPRSIVSA